MKTKLLRILLTILGITLFFIFFSGLLTPTWYDYNNNNTMKGIYREPPNSIQVLFLGASKVVSGLSPMFLYHDFGMCSYNMGTENQKMLISYYWLKEIYRLHSQSLNTVVLDLSRFFTTVPFDGMEWDDKALAYMQLSPVKIEAIQACADEYENYDFWEHIFPLITYHSRWNSVNENDFSGLTTEKNQFFSRGQYMIFDEALREPFGIGYPNDTITDSIDYSLDDYAGLWKHSTKKYFDKIVEFCKEKELNLVLLNMRNPTLDDKKNDSLTYLAKINGLPILNINLTSVQAQLGLDCAYDYYDMHHPNFFGGEKITGYVGNFLAENYDIEDIRGRKEYSYLENQYNEYSPFLESSKYINELRSSLSLVDYLTYLRNDHYTIFLSIKGDAAEGLTPEQIRMLDELGFHGITELSPGYAYVGIVDRGITLVDECALSEKDAVAAIGLYDPDDKWSLSGILNPYVPDKHNAVKDGFIITSGGDHSGNFSSVKLFIDEYSVAKRGMNFVVFDNVLGKVVDNCCFDTHLVDGSEMKIPDIRYEEYLASYDSIKLENEKTLAGYLSVAVETNNTITVIFGKNTEKKELLEKKQISELKKLGLNDIGKINEKNYLAVFNGASLVQEITADNDSKFVFKEENPVYHSIISDEKSTSLVIGQQRYEISDGEIVAVTYNSELDKSVGALIVN